MAAYLTETPDEHLWTFEQHRVTGLAFDLASVRVETWTVAATFELRFGALFRLERPDAPPLIIDADAGEGGARFAPLLDLLGAELREVRITRAGELRVRLGDGTLLAADPLPDYEAWEARGAGALGNYGYPCLPGGGSPWG